jgi:predicted DNA-binding transcriptional regulator YafY
MRRADRLFQIVQWVRGRRLSTGEWLAGRLAVSLRTVYRDIADLQAQGVPIDGEAGVGYRMRAGFDLPPLMFTHDEAKALVAAVRLAQPRLDPSACCGRSAAFTGARRGRSPRGASCAATSAASASIASKSSMCRASAFATSRARRWPICSGVRPIHETARRSHHDDDIAQDVKKVR